MSGSWAMFIMATCTLLVQLGGFVFVTRNHLRHIQEALDRIEERVFDHGERLARLEGGFDAERHPPVSRHSR